MTPCATCRIPTGVSVCTTMPICDPWNSSETVFRPTPLTVTGHGLLSHRFTSSRVDHHRTLGPRRTRELTYAHTHTHTHTHTERLASLCSRSHTSHPPLKTPIPGTSSLATKMCPWNTTETRRECCNLMFIESRTNRHAQQTCATSDSDETQ